VSVRGRELAPIYGARFVTAFGAPALAANLGGDALGPHDSFFELESDGSVQDLKETVPEQMSNCGTTRDLRRDGARVGNRCRWNAPPTKYEHTGRCLTRNQ